MSLVNSADGTMNVIKTVNGLLHGSTRSYASNSNSIYDVVIVGGGLVGSGMAAALSKSFSVYNFLPYCHWEV